MSRFVAGRYELKFLISHRQQERMLQEVERWVVPDTNGVDGCYRVTSQYYDTDDLQAYWEKLDGVNQRMKFRLRYYGGEPESPFFEIKHRQNRIIMKERVGLQKPLARELLSTEMGLDELSAGARPKNESELQFAKRLELLGQKFDLGPKVVISYLRTAFLGSENSRVRLTFDHHCRAYRAGEFQAVSLENGEPLEAGDPIVMELKFDNSIPKWLRDAANHVGAKGVRFSKYSKGMDALALTRGSVSSESP